MERWIKGLELAASADGGIRGAVPLLLLPGFPSSPKVDTLSLSRSLSLSLDINIYTYIYICMCIYIHVYIYIDRFSFRSPKASTD